MIPEKPSTMTTDSTLLAVCLGGSVTGCNTELHDVVFVAARTVEEAYDQILAAWFGDPDQVHVDSWRVVDVADGHRVTLAATPAGNGRHLYHVNLGGYRDEVFGEVHANGFFVAATPEEAKARAKAAMARDWTSPAHTDAIVDVGQRLTATGAPFPFPRLEPTDARAASCPRNGYHPLPSEAVAAFLAGRVRRSPT